MNEMTVFNNPVESALRSLILLVESYPGTLIYRSSSISITCWYTAPMLGDPKSLHPATPQRDGRSSVRRDLIEQGLHLLLVRGLAGAAGRPLSVSSTRHLETLPEDSSLLSRRLTANICANALHGLRTHFWPRHESSKRIFQGAHWEIGRRICPHFTRLRGRELSHADRFHHRRSRFRGENISDAVVRFAPGLSVVFGPVEYRKVTQYVVPSTLYSAGAIP